MVAGIRHIGNACGDGIGFGAMPPALAPAVPIATRTEIVRNSSHWQVSIKMLLALGTPQFRSRRHRRDHAGIHHIGGGGSFDINSTCKTPLIPLAVATVENMPEFVTLVVVKAKISVASARPDAVATVEIMPEFITLASPVELTLNASAALCSPVSVAVAEIAPKLFTSAVVAWMPVALAPAPVASVAVPASVPEARLVTSSVAASVIPVVPPERKIAFVHVSIRAHRDALLRQRRRHERGREHREGKATDCEGPRCAEGARWRNRC